MYELVGLYDLPNCVHSGYGDIEPCLWIPL